MKMLLQYVSLIKCTDAQQVFSCDNPIYVKDMLSGEVDHMENSEDPVIVKLVDESSLYLSCTSTKRLFICQKFLIASDPSQIIKSHCMTSVYLCNAAIFYFSWISE